MKVLAILLLSAPLLSGCLMMSAPLLIGGGEVKSCPPAVQRDATVFQRGKSYLMQGQSKFEVQRYVGQPVMSYQQQSSEGTAQVVWRYRTGHRACRFIADKQEYTDVIFRGNQLIGVR